PLGSVVYTQLLNRGGGIVADVTVTRLGDDRFRVVTGAGVVDSDLGWLRANIEPDDGPVALRDASTELAVIGMWGPAARDVLEGATDDDVWAEACPFRAALARRVAGTDVAPRRTAPPGAGPSRTPTVRRRPAPARQTPWWRCSASSSGPRSPRTSSTTPTTCASAAR